MRGRTGRAAEKREPTERTARPPVRLLLLLTCIGGLFAAEPAVAQSDGGSPFEGWARSWRSLSPLAELPQPALRAPDPPDILLAPPPRIGSFWTAGNPAALPDEVEDAWTGFAATRGSAEGSYRRPLDPVRRESDRAHILSWKPVGDWGAAAGEVEAGAVRLEPNAFGRWMEPYQGTPFVLSDTGRVNMDRFVVRAEGAMGVELGRWRVGTAASYRAADTRTEAARFPRDQETIGWGLTVGVSRTLTEDALVLGLYGRGQGVSDETVLIPAAAGGVARVLQGLAEPREIAVTRSPLFRRLERQGEGVGVTAGGRAGGFQWLLYGERSWKAETQTEEPRAEPESGFDRWETDGARLGASLQRRYGRFLLTGRAEGATLSGDARTPDVEQVVYTEDSWRLKGSLGIRLMPRRAGWRAAARLGYWRTERERVDRLAGLSEDLTLVRSSVALSVGKALSERVHLSAGLGVRVHEAEGMIPDAREQDERYRELVGPAIAYDATSADGLSLRGTVLWWAGPRTALWLRGETSDVSTDVAVSSHVELSGNRDRWEMSLGVKLADWR